jgi:HSP20 family molecular chaperone IbpA
MMNIIKVNNMKTCNCTIWITNPEACKYCNNMQDELNGGVFEVFESWLPPYTNLAINNNIANIVVEENEDSWEFIAPLPGAKKEEINVSFKNDVMTITNEDNEFCTNLNYSFAFDYVVEVDMIKVFFEDGILHVIVDKPEDVEFNVEIK